MILISKNLNCEVNIIKQRSRLLVIHLKGEGVDVVIANVYAPNLTAEEKKEKKGLHFWKFKWFWKKASINNGRF